MEWPDAQDILIVGEMEGEALSLLTRQLLGKGRELADTLGANIQIICLGEKAEKMGKDLITLGADIVLNLENDKNLHHDIMIIAQFLANIIRKNKPELVLMGATRKGNHLAPWLAQRFRTGLVTGCVSLSVNLEERLLIMGRPSYGGKLMVEYLCPFQKPQLATIHPGVFGEAFIDDSREGEFKKVSLN